MALELIFELIKFWKNNELKLYNVVRIKCYKLFFYRKYENIDFSF